MILQKELPGMGEIVLVNINKIMPHGAYCQLVEYKADAYLPIGEVASGWIKNIHEFIREGQRDVGKVVFVDAAKKALDISLKKVTSKEKKDKINDYNLEKRAEKFFTQAVQASKKEAKIEEIKQKAAQRVVTYSELLELVQENKDAGILDPDVRKAFQEIIAKNIKPKIYTVHYLVELKSEGNKGTVDMIRKAFGEIESSGVEVLYEGAPHYRISADGPTYPAAEGKIKEAQQILEKYKKQFEITVKK